MYIRTPEEANEHKSLKERSEIGALSNALFGKVRDGFLQDWWGISESDPEFLTWSFP